MFQDDAERILGDLLAWVQDNPIIVILILFVVFINFPDAQAPEPGARRQGRRRR